MLEGLGHLLSIVTLKNKKMDFFWRTLVLYFCWVDDNAIFDVNKWSTIYSLHDITEMGLQSLGTTYVCSSSCYKILGFLVSLVRYQYCWAHSLFLLSRQKRYNVVRNNAFFKKCKHFKTKKKKKKKVGWGGTGFQRMVFKFYILIQTCVSLFWFQAPTRFSRFSICTCY